MNDDKARKAAEEYAGSEDWNNYWRAYENDPIGQSGYIDGTEIAELSFLAGVAWARANPGWIKCSERMPESMRTPTRCDVSEEVFMKLRSGYRLIGRFDTHVDRWVTNGIYYDRELVTGWCAIPPVPEGE
jgi:hypothetical protein